MEYRTSDQIVRAVIRNRLLRSVHYKIGAKPSLEEMRKIQWSDTFERLMRNRMLFGGYRYDTVDENLKKELPPSIFIHMTQLIGAYKKTRNTELLVDLANYALLCFIHDKHPQKHFHSPDDAGHFNGGSWNES